MVTPARYLGQLCKHFAHRLPVTLAERHGRIEFASALCKLETSEDDTALILRLTGADEARSPAAGRGRAPLAAVRVPRAAGHTMDACRAGRFRRQVNEGRGGATNVRRTDHGRGPSRPPGAADAEAGGVACASSSTCMGMTESGRQGNSVYLRGWDDYERYSLKLTGSHTSGLGHAAFRARSPQALAAAGRGAAAIRAGDRLARGRARARARPTSSTIRTAICSRSITRPNGTRRPRRCARR